MYLLSFYYDFLLKYIGRNQFEFMECDTDSTYIALPNKTLAECILPAIKEKFNAALQIIAQIIIALKSIITLPGPVVKSTSGSTTKHPDWLKKNVFVQK